MSCISHRSDLQSVAGRRQTELGTNDAAEAPPVAPGDPLGRGQPRPARRRRHFPQVRNATCFQVPSWCVVRDVPAQVRRDLLRDATQGVFDVKLGGIVNVLQHGRNLSREGSFGKEPPQNSDGVISVAIVTSIIVCCRVGGHAEHRDIFPRDKKRSENVNQNAASRAPTSPRREYRVCCSFAQQCWN